LWRLRHNIGELANPNLHDIPTRLPFRVELWDRHNQHIRWVIAAASSVAVGHAPATRLNKDGRPVGEREGGGAPNGNAGYARPGPAVDNQSRRTHRAGLASNAGLSIQKSRR